MQIRPTQKRMQIRSAAGCEVGDAVYDQKERRDRRDKERLKAGRDGNEPRAKKNPDKLEFSFLLYPSLYASTLLLFNPHLPLFLSLSLFFSLFFFILPHFFLSFSHNSAPPAIFLVSFAVSSVALSPFILLSFFSSLSSLFAPLSLRFFRGPSHSAV